MGAIAAGVKGIDITDTPTGESHSMSITAAQHIKEVYRIPVICHVRTRSQTEESVKSLARSADVWDIDALLFVQGEGPRTSGLTPTECLELVRHEGLLENSNTKLGVLVDPAKIAVTHKKLRRQPDFVYSVPLKSISEYESLKALLRGQKVTTYVSVMVPTPLNRAIFERIGMPQMPDISDVSALSNQVLRDGLHLCVISPADLDGGLSFVKGLH